jgi:hypothetical protein
VVGLGTDIAGQLAAFAESKGWQVALSFDAAKNGGVLDLGERQTLALADKGGSAETIDVIGIARGRDIEITDPVEPASAAG